MKINLAIFQQEEYGNIVCGWVGDRGSDFCVFSIIEINTNQVKKERVNGIQKLSIKNEKNVIISSLKELYEEKKIQKEFAIF